MEAAKDGHGIHALTLGRHFKQMGLLGESIHWFTVAAEKDSALLDDANKEMDGAFGRVLHH